jgi:uncharacterized membrane protein
VLTIYLTLAFFFLAGLMHLFPRLMAMFDLLSRNEFFVNERASDPEFLRWCRFNAVVLIAGSLAFFVAAVITQSR